LITYEKKINKQDFWDNNDFAQKVLKELKYIKETIENYENMKESIEDLEVLVELAVEENDNSVYDEIKDSINSLEKELGDLKIKTLLDGEYDGNNAILSLNAGTGGLDAQDWTQMLLRMYIRWAEDRDFKVRLGKRQTSFASVDVVPELDDSIEVDINPSDLKIDTYRASGAGGQHVNTTDSAVRITHIPTGIVVQCQNERSQHLNRERAMRMLMAKLIELKESEQKEKIEDLQGKYSQITWGSQIRSYVFQPYKLVKDSRTNAESGNVDAVMDGDIDLFINEYLKMNKSINYRGCL